MFWNKKKKEKKMNEDTYCEQDYDYEYDPLYTRPKDVKPERDILYLFEEFRYMNRSINDLHGKINALAKHIGVMVYKPPLNSYDVKPIQNKTGGAVASKNQKRK